MSVRSVDNSHTSFRAQSTADQESIRIDKLWVGSDRLQIEMSGSAIVTANGEVQTINLWDRLKKYPLPAAIFVIVNAAIVTWLGKIIRSFFPRSQP